MNSLLSYDKITINGAHHLLDLDTSGCVAFGLQMDRRIIDAAVNCPQDAKADTIAFLKNKLKEYPPSKPWGHRSLTTLIKMVRTGKSSF